MVSLSTKLRKDGSVGIVISHCVHELVTGVVLYRWNAGITIFDLLCDVSQA